MPPSKQAAVLVVGLLTITQIFLHGVTGWKGGTFSRGSFTTPRHCDRHLCKHEQRICPENALAPWRPAECASHSEYSRGSVIRGRRGTGTRGPASVAESSIESEIEERLAEEDIKTIVSVMNGLPDDLLSYVTAYTSLGVTAKQKNSFTAGSFVLEAAEVKGLDGKGMDVEVAVRTRSFFGQIVEKKEKVRVSFGDGELHSGEAIKRRLMKMSREQGKARSTATIYKIPVGTYSGLPTNMLLNNVPHSKLARNFIYQGAAEAVVAAVQDPQVPRRMKLVCTVPELNVSMDTYRVGTLLEMIREIAYSLADVGLDTRIMVQPSMGKGIFKSLPLALSGVMAILKGMDWEDDVLESHIRFGQLGEEGSVSPEDDVLIVISPQSIAGFTVHDRLVDTVKEAAGRPVLLVNPNLKDRPSAGGVMQVRGRGDRMSFAESFEDVYNYRLLYASSVGFFPIKGAVMKGGPWDPYVVFDRQNNDKGEEYVPVATFDDDPGAAEITPLFLNSQ